jgi:hypothetical protein
MSWFTKITHGFRATLAILAALAATAPAVQAETAEQNPLEGTLVCRASHPTENVTAKMVSSSTTLVCRPIAVAMRKGDGSLQIIGDVHAQPQPGPDFSKALTPEQVREVCEKWVESVFHIDHNS